MANDFSDEQYTFIFSNSDFVHFVSYFFSSYEDKIQNIRAELSQDDYEELLVFLRVILIKLEEFTTNFHSLIKKISYQYQKKEKIFNGQIRGKLLINHHVKEVAKRSIPKNYHCLIKTKSYSTPENVYIVFGLKEIINKLKKFIIIINDISFKKNKEEITELQKISKYLNELDGYLNKSYFSECEDVVKSIYRTNGHNFPKNERNLIERRIRLRKILNVDSYKKIIYWLDEFLKYDSLSFVDDNTLDMMRYGNSFSDTLFELWCLYKIKETFVNDFDFNEVDIGISFNEGPIFKLFNTKSTLKIYFQKAEGLYWDEDHEREWSYYNEGSYRKLIGKPDITIVKEEEDKSIIMIDIKNKIRSFGGNSEEIYKMIGYFSNFYKMFEYFNKNYNNHAVLIFRNEDSSFNELITNQKGTNLLNVSVSLSDNSNLCDSQFKLVCNHILNNQKNR